MTIRLTNVRAPQDAIEVAWQLPQQAFVGFRMQPPNARNLGRFLDYSHRVPRRVRILDQHADIHPFIALKFGR